MPTQPINDDDYMTHRVTVYHVVQASKTNGHYIRAYGTRRVIVDGDQSNEVAEDELRHRLEFYDKSDTDPDTDSYDLEYNANIVYQLTDASTIEVQVRTGSYTDADRANVN